MYGRQLAEWSSRLILMRETQESSFSPVGSEQLQANRKPFRRKSARNADARNARKIRGHGVNIVEVHREWIVNFLSELECRRRAWSASRWRRTSQMLGKVLSQQGAHLLSFQIVSIVITRRQDISAKHDAALHFRTETFVPRLAIHVAQSRRILGTKAIAHAIVASEVRRSFGRRDDVINRDRILRMRQIDVDDLGAKIAL